jgi:hypothetical protein
MEMNCLCIFNTLIEVTYCLKSNWKCVIDIEDHIVQLHVKETDFQIILDNAHLNSKLVVFSSEVADISAGKKYIEISLSLLKIF